MSVVNCKQYHRFVKLIFLSLYGQFSAQLKSEEAYQVFADAILSPPTNEGELSVARSYRALTTLTQDLAAVGTTPALMNSTRAGLLAKQIFSSLGQDRGVLMHKRALLDAVLEAYPSAVVSAACAGGKEGLDAHLRPMMLPESCSQTLPTLTSLVLYGCTGRSSGTSAEHRPTGGMMAPMTKKTLISTGHRRKFVRSLADWSLLQRLAHCIAQEDHSSTPVGLGEEACETLLTIVECIGYPHPEAADIEEPLESVGEEMLLAPLGQAEWWDPLVGIIVHPPAVSETARVAAARAMVGILGLATGRSSRIRRATAPAVDATDDIEAKIGPDDTEDTAANNKLRDWGLTTKIHMSLVTHLPQIVKAMTIDEVKYREDDFKATVYIQSGEDSVSVPVSAVPHPGRCRIVPFTSWRLQIVNLLAELMSYNGDETCEKNGASKGTTGKESPRCAALSALMKLPMPPKLQGEKADNADDDTLVLNPWPTLCDWVFQYPENNLYHVQFLRMFQVICLEQHEATLRLVLQKAKFVSRAVRTCKTGGPLRGVLLTCLNCLRLRSQSLPPRAFLRQFLESHDAWKDFQGDLEA